MIRPGRMTTRIELQARAETPDGLGGVSVSWATIAAVWAEMWSVRGDERAVGSASGAFATHRARIWALPGLTTAHRAKLGSRTFGITFVNDVEQRGVEYVLDLQEIAGRDAA